MGTANQQPSSGIAGLQSQYGGSTLSTGAYADPQDRDLIWDREDQTPIGRAEIGQASGGWRGRPGGPQPVIFKESKAGHHLYNRPDEAGVEELQRRLWAGGFYPPGTEMEDITPGLPDPYTGKAWENLLDRSAKYYAAGKNMTVWEVLDEGAAILGPGGADRAAGRGRERQPLVTELTNPEDLKYVAQRTAVATLGRALKPDELSRFVSSFHGSQQSAQAQAYNAGGTGGPGGSVVSAPDPTAAAASFARQADPTAAGAHDFVRVFDSFSKMLGGKRGRG